jgi:rubrerythrin
MNEASRDARYLGLIPVRDVIDRRSDEPVINLSTDPETSATIFAGGGLNECTPPTFETLHLWIDPPVIPQRYQIELWCEKSTMNDVLIPIGERYGVNVVTGNGELSLTRCVELVDRAEEGRPVRILYISDFDPGGQSMPVAVARKIEFMIRSEGRDLDIQVRPVVLTHEQCLQYRLPRTPIKEKESRAANFEARFGEGATELDALEALHPGELERILEREIERYYDDTLDDRTNDVMRDVQVELNEINAEVQRRHAKALKALEAERKKTLAAITAFEKKANLVLRKIKQELEGEAPDVDNFDWPEADDGDEDDDPLFDSVRDYVEQIDRYKEHQGKTTEYKTTERACAECGATFSAKRNDAQCCSEKCRNAFSYKRRRAQGTR